MAGRFWTGRPARQEASIDLQLAETLGLELGDTLTLDVQGLPLDAVVTSFRRIRWQAMVPNAIIVLSFLMIFWVIRTNSWAASNIRVEADQKVIDAGPYACVRHPMYAGAIWLFVGIPLALGSWWSIGLLILFFPVLLWRLLDEERILARDLPGYTEYMRRKPYRLVPYVW